MKKRNPEQWVITNNLVDHYKSLYFLVYQLNVIDDKNSKPQIDTGLV